MQVKLATLFTES